MNGFLGLFHFALDEFIDEQRNLKKLNEEKQQACIDKYHDSVKFPRKKKKQIRKEAQRDYNFWVSVNAWHEEEFGLIL